MSTPRKPRRPALLDPGQSEAIVGDSDPAQRSALAHSTAQLLMGIGDNKRDVNQLIQAITHGGIDIVSELWSRSPATTLPGILWRLYLVRQWYIRDSVTVRKRYEEGLAAPVIIGVPDRPNIDLAAFMASVGSVLQGNRTDDFTKLLAAAAIVLRVLASGATFGPDWIDDDKDELADIVTTRAEALLATADEFEVAAQSWKAKRLD